MVPSSLPMKKLAYGGAILVPMDVPRTWWMCVHEIVGAVIQNETQDYANYVGRWAVYGQEMFVLLHEVNNGCYAVFMWNVCVQGRYIRCD